MNALSQYTGPLFCLMRLIIGLLFAAHGCQKLLGFPPGGPEHLEGIFLIGAWIELVCGFLIAFGLFTRIAAFIAAGEMAVAWFMFHFSHGGLYTGKGTPINGESAILYCFVFLFIFFHGPGAWSLDSLVFRNKAAATV